MELRLGWCERYEELKAYRQKNGNCCVPKSQGKLGRWVARQRELKKKGSLNVEREQRLEKLGFTWNTNDSAWEARYKALVDYVRKMHHANVPIAHGDLGLWVAKQRQMKRKGKLSNERMDKLDKLGFTWDTPSADWNEKFAALTRWREQHGHCRVPFNEGELGWWVNTQRQAKRKNKLSAHREDLLNSISFIWNPSATPQTGVRKTLAKRCKRKSGDSLHGRNATVKRHHSFAYGAERRDMVQADDRSGPGGRTLSNFSLPAPTTIPLFSQGNENASSVELTNGRSISYPPGYPPQAYNSRSEPLRMHYDQARDHDQRYYRKWSRNLEDEELVRETRNDCQPGSQEHSNFSEKQQMRGQKQAERYERPHAQEPAWRQYQHQQEILQVQQPSLQRMGQAQANFQHEFPSTLKLERVFHSRSASSPPMPDEPQPYSYPYRLLPPRSAALELQSPNSILPPLRAPEGRVIQSNPRSDARHPDLLPNSAGPMFPPVRLPSLSKIEKLAGIQSPASCSMSLPPLRTESLDSGDMLHPILHPGESSMPGLGHSMEPGRRAASFPPTWRPAPRYGPSASRYGPSGWLDERRPM